METTKQKQEYLENFDDLTTPVGDPEPKITPKLCKVIRVETEKVKNEKVDSVCVNMYVKHPDRDNELKLSRVIYLHDKQIKESALWLKKDSKGKIANNTALAQMLKFYNFVVVGDSIGKEINTALDNKGYICIKAY